MTARNGRSELTTGRRHDRASEQRASYRRRGFVGLAVVMLACVLPLLAISACWSLGRNGEGVKVSASPKRGGANPLTSSQCTGDVYIFFEGAQITEVTYYIDDPRGQNAPYGVVRTAPFDLAGTTDNGAAKPFSTSTMANGMHTLLAVVSREDGSRTRYTSTFGISNKVAASKA